MDATTGSTARKPRPNAAKSKPTAAHVKSSATTSHGASAASPKLPSTTSKLSTKVKTTAGVGPSASNAKPGTKPRPGAARAKPSASSGTKPSTTGVKHHAANVNPSAAHPKPGSTVKPPQAGVAGSKPNATSIQTVSAQLDVVHQKAIQSIDDADKAMSMARADLERAKASKEDRNTVVFKANEVAAALLAPGRHVVHLLARHGVLFPPCKQVSKSLTALSKLEAGRHGSDVRVAVVHFDLARALVQFGALNRKSRPAKSLADPLGELLKRFNGLIEEFGKFCEAYYETKAPGSRFKHLLRWNSNKDSLNGFVDRIAELQRDLGGLLSQQAAQHPWKHANALAQIEARLVSNRAFYATIHDADEEVAQAFSSKHGGEADVQFDGRLLKQLAGSVGEGVTQGIANALKGTTAKQDQKVASGKTSIGSKLVTKLLPGLQSKAKTPETHPEPASHEPTRSPGGKAIDHDNPVSAADEVYEEQYVWEYEDAGNELVYYDEDQDDYLQEDRDIDGEPEGVDDEDQNAYLQEVGIRLDGEDDGDQQDTLQENEEAEGEQGEYYDDQDVYPRENEEAEGEQGEYYDDQDVYPQENEGAGGGQGEYYNDQEVDPQEGEDGGSEPGGYDGGGQGHYVDDGDGNQGPKYYPRDNDGYDD